MAQEGPPIEQARAALQDYKKRLTGQDNARLSEVQTLLNLHVDVVSGSFEPDSIEVRRAKLAQSELEQGRYFIPYLYAGILSAPEEIKANPVLEDITPWRNVQRRLRIVDPRLGITIANEAEFYAAGRMAFDQLTITPDSVEAESIIRRMISWVDTNDKNLQSGLGLHSTITFTPAAAEKFDEIQKHMLSDETTQFLSNFDPYQAPEPAPLAEVDSAYQIQLAKLAKIQVTPNPSVIPTQDMQTLLDLALIRIKHPDNPTPDQTATDALVNAVNEYRAQDDATLLFAHAIQEATSTLDETTVRGWTKMALLLLESERMLPASVTSEEEAEQAHAVVIQSMGSDVTDRIYDLVKIGLLYNESVFGTIRAGSMSKLQEALYQYYFDGDAILFENLCEELLRDSHTLTLPDMYAWFAGLRTQYEKTIQARTQDSKRLQFVKNLINEAVQQSREQNNHLDLLTITCQSLVQYMQKNRNNDIARQNAQLGVKIIRALTENYLLAPIDDLYEQKIAQVLRLGRHIWQTPSPDFVERQIANTLAAKALRYNRLKYMESATEPMTNDAYEDFTDQVKAVEETF